MFSKRKVLLSAKVGLCAMLMLLTASVASASVAGDFGITDVGSSYLNKSTINNLALTVTVPDGVNGNTEDILLVDGGDTFYSGDTLVAIPGLGTTTGVGYEEDGTAGFQGTESVVRDLDADSVWTANADTDIHGTPPAAGTTIITAKPAVWDEVQFYDAAGGGAWAAGSDLIWADTGAIRYDNGLDTHVGGATTLNAFGTLTEPTNWTMYYHDDTDGNGQFDAANDWVGLDEDGDAVYTAAADTTVINGTDTPSAGDALYNVILVDNVCTDNTTMSSATCIYTDTDGTPCDGAVGSGTYFLGAGCAAGGDVSVIGTHNWATSNSSFDATTDWIEESYAGPFTYSASADTDIGGTAPAAGTILGNTKDLEWTTMYFHDNNGDVDEWNPATDVVWLDDGNVYYDTGFDTYLAGTALENALGATAEPANWDLWYYDNAGGDDYGQGGGLDWIGVDAGGSGTYSTSADVDVYSGGGLTDGDALVDFAADCAGAGGTQACLHTGTTPIDSGESILVDEGTDQGAAPNGVIDEENDRLTGIEIHNTGTATNSDISSMKIWADGGDDTFDAGPGDDAFLGTAVWDAVDSWDLAIGNYPIVSGGQKLYVSLDMTSNPSHTKTFILGVTQNGVTVASNNDGPTDADIDAPAGTNTKTIHNAPSGGSGGSSGASSILCGNNDLDEGESCDDGGRRSGDGCSAYCELEEGYIWDSANEEVLLESEVVEPEVTTTVEETVEGGTTEEPTTLTDEEVAGNFSDYDATHWAAQYIAQLFNSGIMSGMGDGTFGVANGTTRAEIVKIALLANGIEVLESVDVAPFLDTPLGEWYTPYVAKASELGIVDGYEDGNFRPGNKVNRGEALKILLLAKGVNLDGYDLSSATALSDVSESIWYAVYVAYALDNGIVEGYADGTFKGGNDILRGEIAKLAVLIMMLEM